MPVAQADWAEPGIDSCPADPDQTRTVFEFSEDGGLSIMSVAKLGPEVDLGTITGGDGAGGNIVPIPQPLLSAIVSGAGGSEWFAIAIRLPDEPLSLADARGARPHRWPGIMYVSAEPYSFFSHDPRDYTGILEDVTVTQSEASAYGIAFDATGTLDPAFEFSVGTRHACGDTLRFDLSCCVDPPWEPAGGSFWIYIPAGCNPCRPGLPGPITGYKFRRVGQDIEMRWDPGLAADLGYDFYYDLGS